MLHPNGAASQSGRAVTQHQPGKQSDCNLTHLGCNHQIAIMIPAGRNLCVSHVVLAGQGQNIVVQAEDCRQQATCSGAVADARATAQMAHHGSMVPFLQAPGCTGSSCLKKIISKCRLSGRTADACTSQTVPPCPVQLYGRQQILLPPWLVALRTCMRQAWFHRPASTCRRARGC